MTEELIFISWSVQSMRNSTLRVKLFWSKSMSTIWVTTNPTLTDIFVLWSKTGLKRFSDYLFMIQESKENNYLLTDRTCYNLKAVHNVHPVIPSDNHIVRKTEQRSDRGGNRFSCLSVKTKHYWSIILRCSIHIKSTFVSVMAWLYTQHSCTQ